MYDVLLVATTTACGVVAGVFFTFSTFVMSGLAHLSPADGIRAMQSINRRAITPAFMALLFGTAVLALVMAVLAFGEGEPVVSLAGAVQVFGTIFVTAAVNVPLNNRLDALDPDEVMTHPVWADYLRRWVRWNHLRTASGTLATALLASALLQR